MPPRTLPKPKLCGQKSIAKRFCNHKFECATGYSPRVGRGITDLLVSEAALAKVSIFKFYLHRLPAGNLTTFAKILLVTWRLCLFVSPNTPHTSHTPHTSNTSNRSKSLQITPHDSNSPNLVPQPYHTPKAGPAYAKYLPPKQGIKWKVR